MEGFGEFRQSLTLTVSDAVVVDLVLPLPTVDTAVTVEASAITSRATAVSELVDGQRIRDLPLNGRRFLDLTTLAPGMVTTAARGSRTNPAVSGTRNTSNNYVIDGMSANEERTGIGGMAPANPSNLAVPDVISTEALEEFRVITSNADASFGRGAGGQINVVTKSGTNTPSGSVYEYFRHNRMGARDFFNTGRTSTTTTTRFRHRCAMTSSAAPWAAPSCATVTSSLQATRASVRTRIWSAT